MKTLLIIGGTGFLGKSIIDYTSRNSLKKYNITKIILLSRKRKKIISQNKDIKISYIHKNIRNIKKLPRTDYVIYAANSKKFSENIESIKNFTKVISNLPKDKKILFTSSGVVYCYFNDRNKKKEINEVKIKNTLKLKNYKKKYAEAKIVSEQEIKKLAKRGCNTSIARLFTYAGKRILKNKKFAISNIISQASNKNKKSIKVYSDKVFRSYMYADDLVEWLLNILNSSNRKCPIYNVGSNEAVSIYEFAKMVGSIFNKKVILENKTANKDIDFYVPSITKAKKLLNLKIKFKLEKIISILLNNN